ncbi:MAG: RNA methyltransferase substrate-binding domain-containing protein, partial [Bacteroidota bacterium]
MTRQRLKDLATLASRKGRRTHGLFLVEGVRSVEAAVQGGAPLAEVLVAHEALETPRVSALAEALRQRRVPVEAVSNKDLARVSDARTPQGIVAVSRSIVASAPLAEARRVLVLDGVQDPGNVGALVRT